MSSTLFHSVNPYSREVIATHEAMDTKGIASALYRSQIAYSRWRFVPLSFRQNVIGAIGKGLKKDRETLALRITIEMGKPLSQSIAEVDKSIWLCEHYAGLSFPLTSEEPIADDKTILKYDAIGTVLGIMPWNFPVWQTLRYAIPALYIGNAVLLKPAPNVFGTSGLLETIVKNACGEFADIFEVLVIDVDQIESVIASPVVRGVTFTGSKRAGGIVGAMASRYIKKSVLELGGSDPFIVYSDASVQSAAEAYVASRMNNNGQTCIAAKRAIVEESAFDDFLDAVVQATTSLAVGEPEEQNTYISCIARNDLLNELVNQIDRSSSGLRKVLKGGQTQDTNVYRPEIYEIMDHGVPAWEEELFGPIGVIARFSKREEAIKMANASEYGLGCSIWTRDKDFGVSVASRINAGSIHINKAVSSDPRVPFGGVKSSGYGRELGNQGLLEFANHKWITCR